MLNTRKVFVNFTVISMIVLALQFPISCFFRLANYFDEIFTIFLLVFFIIRNIRIKKSVFMELLLVMLIVVIGLASNINSNYQNSSIAIIGDIISVIKVPLVLILYTNTAKDNENKSVIKMLTKFSKLYIIIAFIVAVYAYLFHINTFFASERYGIGAYKFICRNAGIFGYLVMGMVALLSFNKNEIKNKKIIVILGLTLIALTTKGPQLLFVGIYIFLYLIRINKIKWYHFLAIGVISIVVGSYQIQHYLKPTEARYALTAASFIIAKDHFPFGTGFATFGSEMSKAFSYSPVYIKYGLNFIRGLNEEYTAYVTDNYWPMILGQLGYISLLVFICFYYKVFKRINETNDKNVKRIILSLFITFMIGSLGSQYLTSAEGVFCFCILAMYFCANKKGRIK